MHTRKILGLLFTALGLANQALYADEKKDTAPAESLFKIDPQAPISQLLPAQPTGAMKPPVLIGDDLQQVPEVMLGDPLSSRQRKEKALKQIAENMAKINHLNRKDPDGFMIALRVRRQDLRGLPFRMGKECRTSPEQAILANVPVRLIHTFSGQATRNTETSDADEKAAMEKAWDSIRAIRTRVPGLRKPEISGSFDGVVVSMAMQILGPKSASLRVSLASFLAKLPHENATKGLAKLAIFSPENEVRMAAIEGLKGRPAKDYTDVLLQGFRYPLPAVFQRTAEALVTLQRKDLVEDLLKVLEEPDPRLPIKKMVDGKEVYVMRELVRVNHHRNCLLCHSPGNTPKIPFGVMTVTVPLPTEPLPAPTDLNGLGYGGPPSPHIPPTPMDILVRIDTTYLRQDFSMMMPVPGARPWPEQQRFDFLVRSRLLMPLEALEFERQFSATQLSPYHRAAVYALRALTGRDALPSALAWRELLKE